MKERGRSAAVPIAASCGLFVGLVTYVLVAPFQCDPRGSCKGWVAFNYTSDSPGHWQTYGSGGVLHTSSSLNPDGWVTGGPAFLVVICR